MAYNITSLTDLVAQFEKLPGIGKKTAQRLAFHILAQPAEMAQKFASALITAREKIHFCSCCQALTDTDICAICADSDRDSSTICVVEDPKDVLAFEKTREYRGLYHVLHGAFSPLDGIGPEQLKIKELMARLSNTNVKELIMATNLTVEGEATAMYLSRLIKPIGVKVSRLAYGVPVGADLEFADEVTIVKAIEGRNDL